MLDNKILPEKKLKNNGISLGIPLVLVMLSSFLFSTSLIPLPLNDLWWYLMNGEYINNNHSIPTTNIYAWTLPPDRLLYITGRQWLENIPILLLISFVTTFYAWTYDQVLLIPAIIQAAVWMKQSGEIGQCYY
jgi:hypothetical protein